MTQTTKPQHLCTVPAGSIIRHHVAATPAVELDGEVLLAAKPARTIVGVVTRPTGMAELGNAGFRVDTATGPAYLARTALVEVL